MGNLFINKPVTTDTAGFHDELTKRLIRETQAGLPIAPEPYAVVAKKLGVSTEEVIKRLETMLATGAIRRIGAVPNHYALGYRGNGMSVWDIPDALIDEVGKEMAALDYVSHCYQRPRFGSEWPYNLFAMVHGKNRAEVLNRIDDMQQRMGTRARSHDVLFSTQILKKTGFRMTPS